MPVLPSGLVRAADRVVPPAVMRRARVLKFDLSRRLHRDRVVEHTYAGVRHRVLIGSAYGERYDADWPALKEIEWLRQRRLRPGSRVFDLGASQGVIALMLADAVGESGSVVALEAHPKDAETLVANQRLNTLRQLECVHAAVARESGTVVFARNGTVDDGTRRWGDLEVQAYSIDELARRHGQPDVVFIDVEGYEQEALLGAPLTLAAGPDWFVEVHGDDALGRYGGSVQGVIDVFADAGYELHYTPDSGYTTGADGTPVARHPILPLPPEVRPQLTGRFFLLATRRRSA